MKKVLFVIVLLALIYLGLFDNLITFILWVFMINYCWSDVSIIGEILVRTFTFAISYLLVGAVFGCFGGRVKSFAYFVFSSLIGFILSWVVWKIEQNTVVVLIALLIIISLLVFLVVGIYFANKSRQDCKNINQEDE